MPQQCYCSVDARTKAAWADSHHRGQSREKVIAIHSGGRTPTQDDLLPPGEQAGRMLVRARFGAVPVEDIAQCCLVAGRQISATNADGELPRH